MRLCGLDLLALDARWSRCGVCKRPKPYLAQPGCWLIKLAGYMLLLQGCGVLRLRRQGRL